jgi:hypothetical protein
VGWICSLDGEIKNEYRILSLITLECKFRETIFFMYTARSILIG